MTTSVLNIGSKHEMDGLQRKPAKLLSPVNEVPPNQNTYTRAAESHGEMLCA